MKKTIKFTTGLSLQILLLGLIGFFGTFLSDYLSSIEWFGDYQDTHWDHKTGRYVVNGELSHGARHIWYIITLSTLTGIQMVRIFMWSIAFWDDEAKKILS